jgi:hypothetical protein
VKDAVNKHMASDRILPLAWKRLFVYFTSGPYQAILHKALCSFFAGIIDYFLAAGKAD